MPWTRLPDAPPISEADWSARCLTYAEAMREAQDQALAQDERVILMGEGVDDRGGAIYGTTRGLQQTYGEERVFDLPLSENGFTGMANGAAMAGIRPVVIHMRMDFLAMAMDQILNHTAKWRFMTGDRMSLPMVIRVVIGRGWGSGAQHSQSLQGIFQHVPGLKLVMPATPTDAKGLFLAAVADPDPVLFVEHRWLHGHSGPVPEGLYRIPIGAARIAREGQDVTVAALSWMVPEALAAAKTLDAEGISLEVIDLRSLVPLDEEALLNSVRRTGRLVVADTGNRTGGAAAEIAALAAEKAFDSLTAPIHRVTAPDISVPAAADQEADYFQDQVAIVATVRKLMGK